MNCFGRLGGFDALLARLERGTPPSAAAAAGASTPPRGEHVHLAKSALGEVDAYIDFIGCVCESLTPALSARFFPRFRSAIVARYSLLDDDELRTVNDARVTKSIETLSRIESGVASQRRPAAASAAEKERAAAGGGGATALAIEIEPGRLAEELGAAIALCKVRSGNVMMNVQGMERLKELLSEAVRFFISFVCNLFFCLLIYSFLAHLLLPGAQRAVRSRRS